VYAEHSWYRECSKLLCHHSKINARVLSNSLKFKKVRELTKDTLVLHPHETTVDHEIWEQNHEANQNFVNWYHHGLYGDKPDFKLVLFNCETWFQISGKVKCQNNRFTMLIHGMSKHDDIKVCVWCAVRVTRITGPFSPRQYIHTIGYTYFDNISFEHTYVLRGKGWLFPARERNYSHTNNSVLPRNGWWHHEEEGIVASVRSIWTRAISYYFGGTLRHKVYSNSPCNECNLKESTQNTVFSMLSAELRRKINE
jgi:hypothetical protein